MANPVGSYRRRWQALGPTSQVLSTLYPLFKGCPPFVWSNLLQYLLEFHLGKSVKTTMGPWTHNFFSGVNHWNLTTICFPSFRLTLVPALSCSLLNLTLSLISPIPTDLPLLSWPIITHTWCPWSLIPSDTTDSGVGHYFLCLLLDCVSITVENLLRKSYRSQHILPFIKSFSDVFHCCSLNAKCPLFGHLAPS